jgi:subtilisin family serine protease
MALQPSAAVKGSEVQVQKKNKNSAKQYVACSQDAEAYIDCYVAAALPAVCCSNSKVAILAPGYDIEAAGTAAMSGTSQATPFVTASIAVVRGRYPSWTQDQVMALLTSTGKKVRT